MTTIQPEHVDHGTCAHCARVKPLHTDGTVITHYLRTRQADRSLRKRCPGSRQAPRPPLNPAEQQIVNATDQAIHSVTRAIEQIKVIDQAWTKHFGDTP